MKQLICAAAVCYASVVSSPLRAQRGPAELAPVAPAIAKVYDKGADGMEFFRISNVVLEPVTGALWVQHSDGWSIVRIDRKTGALKTIGRKGAGPDEYAQIVGMAAGTHGDVGVWEGSRRLWFWVDSSGHQARTWSAATGNYMYGRVFTDSRGNAYVGQPGADKQFFVRIDSARGLIDSVVVPIADDPKWQWNAVKQTTNSKSSATFGVYGAPYVFSGIDARGRMFAGWSDSNFIMIRDGSRERRLLLPDQREPIDAVSLANAKKYLDQSEQSARAQGMEFKNPRPPLPTQRSQISSVIPDMDGGLLAIRSRVCAEIPEWRSPGSRAHAADPKARCAYVERFDAEGRRLKPFTLLLGDRLKAMRGDTAWVVRSTTDDLERILELVIPK